MHTLMQIENSSSTLGQSRAHGGSAGPSRAIPETVRILEDAGHTIVRAPEAACAAAARLDVILHLPTPATTTGTHGGLAPWRRRKVERYLREHLQHPVRVADLAAEAALSASHFSRAFRATFGDTPHAYIVRLRLELVQELMLDTEDPLCQIALACCFADQAHLTRVFRRLVGEPPGAWRRRHRVNAGTGARRLAIPGGDMHPKALDIMSRRMAGVAVVSAFQEHGGL